MSTKTSFRHIPKLPTKSNRSYSPSIYILRYAQSGALHTDDLEYEIFQSLFAPSR